MLRQTKNVKAKWVGKVLVAYKDSAVCCLLISMAG